MEERFCSVDIVVDVYLMESSWGCLEGSLLKNFEQKDAGLDK